MAASERRFVTAALGAAAVLAVLVGCSSAPEVDLAARPTEAKEEIERTKAAAEEGSAAELPEATDAEVPPPPPATTAPADPSAPVHFESARSGAEAPEQPSLYEASQAERQRRREQSTPPAIIITNANLDDLARGGNLTESMGRGEEAEADSPAVSAPPADDPETYWRTRARDVRLAWRAAADRAAELEKEVARLRFEFYSQDDPAYRDLEIKPAWDRALVELAQARMHVGDLEAQVERTLAEGVEAGALPGWLREGIDFEPEPSDRSGRPSEPGTAVVIEPPVLEDPPL